VKARVLVADPPWKFGDSLPGKKRGAAKHYPCMPVIGYGSISRFPLPPLEDNAVLFLWRVAAMQNEAVIVAMNWGFVVKAELIWLKQTKTGKRHFGMGRQFRNEHESCLVATRGRVTPKVKNVCSTFTASAGAHSAKPDEFYEIVERMYDGPYVELFARRQREGWSCYGNELAKAQP
jgi:N6-adenosine-specific RNA methylase IME4